MSNATQTQQTTTSNMTYAQALTDAKGLIVQQSNRIKADAERIKSQRQEIDRLRAVGAEMTREIERLHDVDRHLAETVAAKEQADAAVGRQRVQIDALESAARELQRVLGEQAERISDLTREVESLREQLPTDADHAALAAMSNLLQSARRAKPAATGPALVSDDREDAAAAAAADDAEPLRQAA
jgi:predicted RNase H-like nuclease (RuvC/YqgF family)